MIKLVDYKKLNEKIIVTPEMKQVVLEVPEGDVSKNLDVILDKEGLEVEILGVYVGTNNQQINLTVNAIHKAPNTKCLTQVRGILKDSSYSSFKGLIKIEKKAQQTNSYLDDDVLILGEKAQNKSEPMLEIEADDVKATHGATTGQISEDQVFYLQSRGLSLEDAQGLIMKGFLDTVISRISDDTIREKVTGKIWKNL